MGARVKIYKWGGQWWWELRSYDERMITPDRFIDSGEGNTQASALADAEVAFRAFTHRPDFQDEHHEDTDSEGGWAA